MAIVKGTSGNDTITPTEVSDGVIGLPTTGNDEIWGYDGWDILDGGEGDDTLRGGAGQDTYHLYSGSDTVIEKADEGIDKVLTTSSYTLTDHVEKLQLLGSAPIDGFGNSLDNYIWGNNAANILNGAAGNDTLRGEGGDDTYYVDSAQDVVIEELNEGADRVYSSVNYVLPENVEYLHLGGSRQAFDGTGNDLDNAILGNPLDNTLEGMRGDDTLLGFQGEDTLDGGADADAMYGGQDNDTYYVDNINDRVVENANEGADTINSSITYTLGSHVENLTLIGNGDIWGYGNDLDNIIRGNSGDNLIDGRKGADQMYGGAGNDIYKVDNVGDRIFEEAFSGNDTVEAVGSYSLLNTHVENLTLLGAVSYGRGNEANNVIDARDALAESGSGGVITLEGYSGNDTIHGTDRFGTTDKIYGGYQRDVLYGYAGNDQLYGESDRDTLHGGDDNDKLVGGGDSDFLYGEAGDDTLIGSAESGRPVGDEQDDENDRLWGGAGRDTFVLANSSFGSFYRNDSSAAIKDFNRLQDKIQLYSLGRGNYSLSVSQGSHTRILYDGNLIAEVENNVGLDLNANYFEYI